MRQKIFFLSLIGNVFLTIALGYHFLFQHAQMAFFSKYSRDKDIIINTSSIKHRIAIVVPATHNALEEIQRGFEETLIKKYKLNATFSTFNANGNRALLRTQIEEVGQQQFDLVFTIGAAATQLTKEVFLKKNFKTPIVFGAVADPIRLGLVTDLNNENNIVTGSATSTNYPLQIELMFIVKPNIKKVLLVYDPVQSSGLEIDRKQVEKLFAEHGAQCKVVEVFNTREISQKLPLIIDKSTDLVMILKDNTVVPAIDLLVKQCERNSVTLLTSDLGSVEKGAGIGFGVHEYTFGADAATCASKILLTHLTAGQVPIKITDDFRFAMNRAAMERQGIQLEDKNFKLIRVAEFIDS